MNALGSRCLGLLLGCLIAVPAASAGVPANAPPARIRVVADRDFPPYLFLGRDGKPQGYEADMWRLFEAHTGIKVDLEPMTWADARQALQSGQADVIDMIYRTPSREARYDFSPPYASSAVAIYVDRSIQGVHDVGSLRGLSVAVQRGDVCSEKLKSLGVTDLHDFDDYQDIIQAAAQGTVRVFCMGRNPADFFLYRHSIRDRFNPAFVLFTEHLQRAVRKGNAAMLAAVDRGMAEITPAERATLRQRWLDQDDGAHVDLRVLGAVAGAILAVITLMVLWVWSLRRTVARRTRELQAERTILRSLFDANPDVVTVKDRNGVYVDCNDVAARYFKTERERFIGSTCHDLLSAEVADKLQALDAEVLRSGQPRSMMLSTDSAGEAPAQFEITKSPWPGPDGALQGVLTMGRDITERRQTDARLRMWAHAFEHAASGVVICDAPTRRIIVANPTFARERGYSPEEMAGMPVDNLYPPDIAAEREAARRVADQRIHTVVETEQITRNGRRFPVLLDITVLHDDDGNAQHVVVYAQDITERRQAERELRLAAVAFEAQEAMMVLDADQAIRRVNQAFCQLTGYAVDEVVGQSPELLAARQTDPAKRESAWAQVRETGFWQGEDWLQPRQGQPKVVRTTLSTVQDDSGSISQYVCSMIDLTSERMAHASVDHMTFFDPLTDLPNRYFLYGRLQHLLDATAPRTGGTLLMIDLDHFKRINDSRGHAAGDRLLLLVTQRLRQLLDDGCLLGRFGGGTFALLEGCRDSGRPAQPEQAWACAGAVREALRAPFDMDGTPVTITASIGWTLLVPGQSTPDAALKEAELATYAAKAAGRDQVRRFEPFMQSELLRREALLEDLRHALANDAFTVHMQALTDRTGQITGAEMLLRWTRPCGEAVSPGEFIPVAEDSGLIIPIGDWVLGRACAQLAAWSANPVTRNLVLAINVSARQFTNPEFVHKVRQALAATGANPSRLNLEITETAILGDLEEITEKLDELRAQGISVSLDDFGTGYSSLSYLSRLPLDQIKIDQSFVSRIPGGANDAMVAQTIVAMGHGLDMQVVAEGVETREQLDFLLAQGCDTFQGYFLARPMPLEAFEAMLEARLTPV